MGQGRLARAVALPSPGSQAGRDRRLSTAAADALRAHPITSLVVLGLDVDRTRAFDKGATGQVQAFVQEHVGFPRRNQGALQISQDHGRDHDAPALSHTVGFAHLRRQSRGQGGFGYDPLFYIPRYGGTMAELGPEIKNRISHRARALQAARPILERLIKEQK